LHKTRSRFQLIQQEYGGIIQESMQNNLPSTIVLKPNRRTVKGSAGIVAFLKYRRLSANWRNYFFLEEKEGDRHACKKA
jgi:hypothetical protein